jgi:cytidine deaminase
VSYTLKPGERQKLLEMANNVARNAHAVYSGFHVGAAVLGEAGTYLGTNVENASYPVGLCAERAALAAAVAADEKHIRAIAVACIDAPVDGPREALFPCGACRQWFAELAPNAIVIVGGVDDREFTVGELLPHAFLLARS